MVQVDPGVISSLRSLKNCTCRPPSSLAVHQRFSATAESSDPIAAAAPKLMSEPDGPASVMGIRDWQDKGSEFTLP